MIEIGRDFLDLVFTEPGLKPVHSIPQPLQVFLKRYQIDLAGLIRMLPNQFAGLLQRFFNSGFFQFHITQHVLQHPLAVFAGTFPRRQGIINKIIDMLDFPIRLIGHQGFDQPFSLGDRGFHHFGFAGFARFGNDLLQLLNLPVNRLPFGIELLNQSAANPAFIAEIQNLLLQFKFNLGYHFVELTVLPIQHLFFHFFKLIELLQQSAALFIITIGNIQHTAGIGHISQIF